MADPALTAAPDNDIIVMENLESNPPPTTAVSMQEPNVQEAPYALNQDRLAANLLSAASSELPDLAITVNDNGGNVNLQCSPAYFVAVAKPTLLSLNTGFKKTVSGFSISMSSKPTTTKDVNKLLQNTLLKFSILTNSQASTGVGKVSIHLHTSTNKPPMVCDLFQ